MRLAEAHASAPDNDCIAKPQLVKAFAYLRVSGLGQVDGDGFDRQLIAIKKYAASNGMKLVGVYREEGVSGKTDSFDRPAWTQMVEDMQSNGAVTTVLIERLDRLARDLLIQETLLAEMKKQGLTLVSCAEPDLCSEDHSRKLMRQIFGSIYEYERALLVAKLKGSRERMRAKTGKCEGRKPYGARPGEPEVITRIVELRTQGKAMDTIAELLNAEGVASRSGGLWYGPSVRNVLMRAEAGR